MQQHAFGHEGCFNGARRGLFVHAAEVDDADHGQLDRAVGGDAHGGVKFRRVGFADVEEIAGGDGRGHGRRALRGGERRLAGSGGVVPKHRCFLGIGRVPILLRRRGLDDTARQPGGVGRGRLRVETYAGGEQGQESRPDAGGETGSGFVQQGFAQQRGGHGDPQADKEGDCEVKRRIGRDRLGRLAGGVDDRDVGTVHSSGEACFLGFLKHAEIEVVAGVVILAHDGVLRDGRVQLHALAGRLLEVVAHQLLAIDGGLPVAAEACDEFGVFGLFLPVEILELAADFDDARKAGPVFGAELGLFLLQIAAPGVNLIEERGGKVGA